MDIVLATENINKIREINDTLKKLPIKIITIKKFSNLPPIIEDGNTFFENALKKSTTIANFTKKVTIADDSGLEVDFLGGRPGVYSSRYAGECASDADNNHKLLKELIDVPLQQRKASFKCAMAITNPFGKSDYVEGECRGVIGLELKGSGGFGYDPLFFIPELGKTFAELGFFVKNGISHRAKALEKLKPLIIEYLT